MNIWPRHSASTVHCTAPDFLKDWQPWNGWDDDIDVVLLSKWSCSRPLASNTVVELKALKGYKKALKTRSAKDVTYNKRLKMKRDTREKKQSFSWEKRYSFVGYLSSFSAVHLRCLELSAVKKILRNIYRAAKQQISWVVSHL